MPAYEYPLLGAIWTIVFIGILVILLYLVLRVFADILRSPDMGGLVKVLWMILIILVPFLGIAIYVGFRAYGMSQRDVRAARADRLRREAAGGSSSTSWHDL